MILPPSVGFDLETWGKKQEYALQSFRAQHGLAGIKAASLSTVDRSAGYLYPSVDTVRKMLLLAINNGYYVVGWNVIFDAAWCIAVGLEEEVFAAKWLDAMLLWRHAVVEPEGEDVPKAKRKRYSLEAAMQEFYPSEAGFKEFTDFQATDAESLQLLLHRNKEDARWTLILADKFWNMLNSRQQTAALIEARCIPLMAKTRVMGIAASESAAQELYDNLSDEYKVLYSELLSKAPEIEGINLGSSPQLQNLLYNTWKLPAERFSKKTSNPSTDKYALFDLAAIDPRAQMLKKIREAKNNRKKYAEGTLNSLRYNGDGFVRPQAKIFSTYTSRMTYWSSESAVVEIEKTTKKNGTQVVRKKVEVPSGIALHQWKRGKNYRRIIMAPPGYLLCEFDFAGQEFRWMAVESGDDTMLSLCAPGEDPHGYMGAQIAKEDYRDLVRRVKSGGDAKADLDRKCGKFCNLSYQYRVSARTATVKARVEYELDVDESFVKQTQHIYRTSYPGVGGLPYERQGGYWGRQIQKCKRLGYAETLAGRRVQLRGNWAGRDAWAMESTAINFPIQGVGGDQKYLALAVARNLLPEFCGHVYMELHDGLFFIFPEDKAVAASEVFLDKLSNLPYKQAWGVDLPIQFPVDAKIGRTWGDLVDLSKWKK